MEQLSQFAEIGLFFYMLCKNPFETSTNIGLQLLRKLDLKKAPLVRSCETGPSLQEAFALTILQFTCKAWTKVVKDICWNDNITTNNRNSLSQTKWYDGNQPTVSHALLVIKIWPMWAVLSQLLSFTFHDDHDDNRDVCDNYYNRHEDNIYYRTRVRSLVLLVTHSLTDSLTDWLTPV